MVDKNRKNINAEMQEISPYDLSSTLGELKTRIEGYIKEYGENATLDWDADRWYPYDEKPSPTYYIKKVRPETDAEMQKRIAKEETSEQQRKEWEEKEFERLKAKLGK
jgi:hypothetical protein